MPHAYVAPGSRRHRQPGRAQRAKARPPARGARLAGRAGLGGGMDANQRVRRRYPPCGCRGRAACPAALRLRRRRHAQRGGQRPRGHRDRPGGHSRGHSEPLGARDRRPKETPRGRPASCRGRSARDRPRQGRRTLLPADGGLRHRRGSCPQRLPRHQGALWCSGLRHRRRPRSPQLPRHTRAHPPRRRRAVSAGHDAPCRQHSELRRTREDRRRCRRR